MLQTFLRLKAGVPCLTAVPGNLSGKGTWLKLCPGEITSSWVSVSGLSSQINSEPERSFGNGISDKFKTGNKTESNQCLK